MKVALALVVAALVWAGSQGSPVAAIGIGDTMLSMAASVATTIMTTTATNTGAAAPQRQTDRRGTTTQRPKPKGQVTRDDVYGKFQKLTPSEEKAARLSARARGMKPGVAGLRAPGTRMPAAPGAPLPGIEGPGGVPHYFGPYGNFAFSPLPRGPITSVRVDDGGSGYAVGDTFPVLDAYGIGSGESVSVATVGARGAILTMTVAGTGTDYVAPVIDFGAGNAIATAIITPVAGTGLRKFVDALPGLGPAGANGLGQFIPVAVPAPWPAGCTGSACTADYYEIAVVEYAERMHSDLPQPTRLRGYVQIVPQGWTGTDILGNTYNAVPLTTANGLTQDVTIGGVQAYGASRPHYLGPVIVARGRAHGVASPDGDARPVRVKFHNLLPSSTATAAAVPVGTGLRPGDLFIPVDESVPGSGAGPALPGTFNDKYTQNRMTVHLHGNNTVWLSDGNTHQWITPATENTPYPAGVSARNVPDMPGCAEDEINSPLLPGRSGCMTFYYTNNQSARLQFYHDHAHGITRLNVYAGMAAGYVLTDAVEQDLINGTNVSGVNPGLLKVLPDIGIPLVIQDKTFVEADTIFAQDPTWNWGTGLRDTTTGKITEAKTGDLWYPHVYMTVQNPWDLTGTNGVGKWHYGPWFNPPVPTCPGDGTGQPGCIEVGPVPNPYYQPICDTNPADPACTMPWEPPMIPGAPNPSAPGESFFDTMLVNGTAYPYLEVEPRAYRFRILNAANDRFLNLQLYRAYDKAGFDFGAGVTQPASPTTACAVGDPTVTPPVSCTEVKMVPITVNPANQFADTPSGIPDPTTAGPDWIMIGTEGGFMPKPVVVPQQPVGWNLDMGYFAFGIVNQHSIFLGAAERADVIVDFTGLGGQTFILYNDSPAPVPAGAAVFDFYTGNGHQMDAGSAPNTLPGYGPNTRTIMQIRVKTSTPTVDTSAVTLPNLESVFAKTATKRGVFEVSQDTIIVPQAEYNSAYNATFPSSFTGQFLQIADTQKTFRPIGPDGQLLPDPVTIPLEQKAMHDEMGGVYDTMFGRMSGMLGLVNPNSNVHLLIPYGYSSPPTDLVKGSIEFTPVTQLADGTQIWRIFHNGVDTHPIHTHLFHTQIINRVDQSGQVVQPTGPVDPIELGWKDTVRINPLEVTFLALRPTVPTPDLIPFEVPNSIRLIDPGLPEGATLPPPAPAGWFDTTGFQLEGPNAPVNTYVNFGWEYVWHCHILSHEEMDMMHSLVFAVPPLRPDPVSALWNGNTRVPQIQITWTDNSSNETGFTVQRALDPAFTISLTEVAALPASAGKGGTVTYVDRNPVSNATNYYRVWAKGDVVGYNAPPGVSFPTMSADSVSPTASAATTSTLPSAPPSGPSVVTANAAPGPQVIVSWTDTSATEIGFTIERCTVVAPATTCSNFTSVATHGVVTGSSGTGSITDTAVAFGTSYLYQVRAFNALGSSPGVLSNVVTIGALPPAPATFTVSATFNRRWTAQLNWAAVPDAVSYTIERANDLDFAVNVNRVTVTGTSRVENLSRNTVYYYRIRANVVGGSSAWKNAVPFPIRTGN